MDSDLDLPTKNPQRSFCYERFFAKEGLEQIQYHATHDQITAIEDKLKVCLNLFTFLDYEGNPRTPLNISTNTTQTPVNFSTAKLLGQIAPTTRQEVVIMPESKTSPG